MADLASIERALRAADAAGDTEAATTLARAYREASAAPAEAPPERSAAARFGSGVLKGAKDIGAGLATGAGQLGSALLAPYDLAADVVQGRRMGTGNRERLQAIEQFGAENADPESLNYNVANVLPEMAATGAPIARAGTAIASRLPRALGRLAPATGDIAANALYEGGKAMGKGEDVGTAAALGGAGATAGRVLSRALAGMKPLVRKDAQDLIERGIYPTPGQAMGGIVGTLEDKALSLPIVGDIGTAARRRSLADYGRAEVNDALKPLGSKVDATGVEAIEAAQARIGGTYDEALDGMSLTPRHMAQAVGNAMQGMKGIPLLDAQQVAKLSQYVDLRMGPQMAKGANLTGREAKALDAEMGHYARQYSRSNNPADRPLGEAFYELQSNWRDAMAAGSAPEKTALLGAANASYRNLLPLVKAADKAAAQGGVFTPNQLQRSYGPFKQGQSDLNRAAQAVLPSRVPDSGTAGRLMLGAGAAGAGAVADLGTTAAAGAAAYALTSRAGLNRLYNGVAPSLKPSVRQWLDALPDDKKAEFLQRYAKEEPSVQRMAAQIGRELMTQGGEQ